MTPFTSFDLQSLANDTALIGIMLVLMLTVTTLRRENIRLSWFVLALFVFALNAYGLSLGRWIARPLTEGLRWNWSGKILALSLSAIVILFLSKTLQDQIGLRVRQAKGSAKVWIAISVYALIFLVIAWNSPPPRTNQYWESLAFQLTMPSLNEELFFRGLLPVVIDKCFGVSRNVFGAQMGWGAVISSVMFGLVHGLSLDGGISVDWVACAIPGLIGLVGCWIVGKTKSLLGPILMHSHGNAINYII